MSKRESRCKQVKKEAITMKLQTQTLNLESYFSVFDEQKIVVIEVVVFFFFVASFQFFFLRTLLFLALILLENVI